MGCGNNSGKADSTGVTPLGPAEQLHSGSPILPPQSDALTTALINGRNGTLPVYYMDTAGAGRTPYGPPPSGYQLVMALPSSSNSWFASANANAAAIQANAESIYNLEGCGNVPGVYTYSPYIYSNGSQFVTVWQSFYDAGYSSNCSCFPAGALVLMADGSEREIQLVRTGDWVMGADGRPAQVLDVDRPLLGARRMMAFADGSQTWSEEHSFWTRDAAGAEWLWSANPDQWRFEVAVGHIGGLRNNSTMRSGPGYQFAHLSGWIDQDVVEARDYGPETQLYLPRTNGVPIVVNDYVVGAGINQDAYDYEALRWSPEAVAAEVARQAIARVLNSLTTHAAHLPELVA
jgi:hypothetical protein